MNITAARPFLFRVLLMPILLGCGSVSSIAIAQTETAAAAPQQPIDQMGFSAAVVEYDSNTEIVTAKGEVMATREGYSVRADIIAWNRTTGQVIADLKFVFWQTMVTSRFDARRWVHHLRTVLPHADNNKTIPQIRSMVYSELEQIRKLRNRIAHHEPIFQRNLSDDLQKAYELIAFRCPVTALWMDGNQQAKQFISNKPI
jgi:hypothetical protein